MRYTIHYDLFAPETRNDYKRLAKALRDLGAVPILKSGWAVRLTGWTCEGLFNHLWATMDANDRLLVQEVDGTQYTAINLDTPLKNI